MRSDPTVDHGPPGRAPSDGPAAPATIFGVAFTADGRRAVTVGAERAARIWDANRGEPLGRLKGHEATVTGVAIGHDSGAIATASADRTVRLWDIRDDPAHFSPPIDGADGRAVAWVGDAGLLAVGDSSGRAWVGSADDPGSFRSWPAHRGGVTAIAAVGGGRLVTGGRDGVARVWSIEGDHDRPLAEFRGHGEAVSCLAATPDGLSIASGSGTQVGLRATPEGKGPILEGDDRAVRVWDAATGRDRLALRGLPGGVGAVAFAPDGRSLAAGGTGGTILRWELAEGRRLGDPIRHPGIVTALAYRPDGSMLATAGTHEGMKIWSNRDGSERATLDGHAHWAIALAFTPDGSRLFTGGADRTIVAWDPDDRRALLRLDDHDGWVEALAFDRRGDRLATGGGAGRVLVWDGVPRRGAGGLGSRSGPGRP